MLKPTRTHPTADISPQAVIGEETQIWHGAHIREGVRIGRQCVLGKNVYIDFGVQIGDRCKIQNNASIFHGATLEDGVFVGPHACITNDRLPRAITATGELKRADDWEVGVVRLRYGCSVGAGSIILPDVTIGRFAMTGAGAVVTKSVPDHGLVVGNPARLIGFLCACGGRLDSPASAETSGSGSRLLGTCRRCGQQTVLSTD